MNVEKYATAVERYYKYQQILDDDDFCDEIYKEWLIGMQSSDSIVPEQLKRMFPLAVFKQYVIGEQECLKHILVGPIPHIVYNDLCSPDEFMAMRAKWCKEMNE